MLSIIELEEKVMGKQLKEKDLMKQIVNMLTEEKLISCEEQISFLLLLKEEG